MCVWGEGVFQPLHRTQDTTQGQFLWSLTCLNSVFLLLDRLSFQDLKKSEVCPTHSWKGNSLIHAFSKGFGAM